MKTQKDVFVTDDINWIRIGARLSGKGVVNYKSLHLKKDSLFAPKPAAGALPMDRITDTLRRHALNRNNITDTIEFRAKAIANESSGDAMNYLIGKLGDKHASWKENTNEENTAPTSNDHYPLYQRRQTNTGEAFSYVKIPTLKTMNRDFHKRYADSLHNIVSNVSERRLVIDLRGNSGGVLWPMLAGISPLIPDGIQAYFSYVDGRKQPITVKNGKAYSNKSSYFAITDRIIRKNNHPKEIFVVVDERTASAAEMLAGIMTNYSKFKLCGTPTAGFLTGVSSFTFGDSLLLRISTSIFLNKRRQILDGNLVPAISLDDLLGDI